MPWESEAELPYLLILNQSFKRHCSVKDPRPCRSRLRYQRGEPRSLTHERYRAQLTMTLAMLELMPKTPCLLIGPSDRAVKDRQGQWRTWIPTYEVAQSA